MTAPANTSEMKDQRSVFVRRLPLRVAVIAIAIFWSISTLGIFISSLRDARDIQASGWWDALLSPFQTQWTLMNYEAVLGGENMANAFINSLIVSIPATIIPITIAAFAAYAFSWMRFPFRGTLFMGVVALLVVPLQMALIPVQESLSGPGHQPDLPGRLARPCGVRVAASHLPALQLHQPVAR